ncbi:GNAT family N-acetyltransferase [Alisedimentitalea sp. MJ-SS2]|uniref:GNAT family N-acetyltransferase n=1 Tax=Aliisedimentitalea sp. MJ-SS2 TaxID=3049795 RepID=UPI0029154147|nr:GNAT family N-acetyltransferase [Alisedimentitalea sp. MJ-SS2]MDU8928785.1 GNAT family N-acetyltransferase [Alisedimentitalea sp. MJ-SS2]
MTPEDLAILHALAFTRQRPWTAEEFTSLLDSPHVFLCIGPHSFALGRAVAGEAELLTLATDPAHQRKGLGRARLTDFLNQATHMGATEAFLEVDQRNDTAVALYKHAGFTIIATRPAYYTLRDGTRADALVMVRPLPA